MCCSIVACFLAETQYFKYAHKNASSGCGDQSDGKMSLLSANFCKKDIVSIDIAANNSTSAKLVNLWCS